MATTVGAAYTSLYAMLSEDERLDGVQVAYGPPVVYEANEVIALLGFGSIDAEHATFGFDRARQRETYDIRAVIKVFRPGARYADVPALHLRALTLYGVLTDVVQTDPALRGALTDGWAVVGAEEGEESGPFPAVDDELEGGGYIGWVEFINGIIRCEARVS